jgi:hypothetical protein
MLKKPDLCCETGGHQAVGENPKAKEHSASLHSEIKMTNCVSLLLEIDAAKRRLAELFESKTFRSADHQSTAIADRDRSRAARSSVKKNNNTFQEYRRKRTPAGRLTGTAIPTIGSGETKRDLSVSTFMLLLMLVGVAVAAHTDRPVFWLLIGPTPLAVLYTIRTLLQLRVIRREGLLIFCKRDP